MFSFIKRNILRFFSHAKIKGLFGYRFRYSILALLFFFWGVPRFGKIDYYFQGQPALAGYFTKMFFSEEELGIIDHKITQLLIDSGFNGNVLISHFGMLVYNRSFGFSSFGPAEYMNSETTFQLASISKTFTSTAVLLLQQDSLLHIDRTVKEYIPEFPYENITIRQLLSHTSGLQNYMWMVERYWKKPGIPTNEDILQLFLSYPRPLNFSPGLRFDYSNTGFVFLALLVERITGMPYSEFIETRIFAPLEMHRSFVNDLHRPREVENRAYGYRQWRGQHILIPDDKLDGPLGDKGVFSSVHDLLKWDAALYNSKLLPPDVWKMAFENSRLNNDTLVEYGLGWRLQSFLDKRIVHHPGRWHGFRTSFKRFVDDHTTIIVLSNNNRGILKVIEGIQDILYYGEKEIWMAKNIGLKVYEVEEFDE